MTRVEPTDHLRAEQVREVLDLVAEVTDADGVRPLSEHVMLHLRYGGDQPVQHLLARDGHGDGRLIGYAHLDTTDPVEGSSAELAVHPAARGRGTGRALTEALLAATPDGRLRLWAHGQHTAAARLADAMGFHRSRALWQMRRSLFAPLPAPELPAAVSVRTFVVGEDEARWLAVNNRAFADHPDQGKWTLDDVRHREAEPWFDPAGFFLAERSADGVLVGFHWTKVHGADPDAEHGHEPIGEVYVVGVDPVAQGQHLGAVLTLIGLRHLRGRGLGEAMLYVDESNTAAIRLYQKLGFTRWDTDVCFSRTAASPRTATRPAARRASERSAGRHATER